jgi:glycosyltransferase involved in cell wall biosynthesis
MRISAVVIVYNLEAYIGQAIDSVLSQSRKADEIIVVDDCSTDASAERVRAYGDKVRCVRMETNSGALLTALHGVEAASGDIICMLDGDDYWAGNKLEVVEREFSADPDLMLLSHDHVRVDENGADLPIRDDTHRNIASIRRRAKSAAQFSDFLKHTILEQRGYWLGSAYSFRRHLFDAAKFERQIRPFGFDRLRQTYLDLTIAPFLVITNPRKNVGYTPETRFFYRIHDNASMAAGVTPERAARLALKGRNMNELIALILRENHASPAYLRRRQLIVEEYDYLSALYSRDLGTAARLYARLARKYWSWRQLKTETIRFAGVLILGPRKFLVLKKAQRNARAPG